MDNHFTPSCKVVNTLYKMSQLRNSFVVSKVATTLKFLYGKFMQISFKAVKVSAINSTVLKISDYYSEWLLCTYLKCETNTVNIWTIVLQNKVLLFTMVHIY